MPPSSPLLTHPSLLLLFLSLTLLTTSISALKQPTSYCKCICFQNSTIIPLNSPPTTSSSAVSHNSNSFLSRDDNSAGENGNGDDDGTKKKQKHRALTCNDCNRAFCLDYNLPICKNAKEEDVFATCFQRDSLKDRAIVILFILSTSSLLGWALLKPFIVKTTSTISSSLPASTYLPLRHTTTASEDMSSSSGLPRPSGGGGGQLGFGNDGVLDDVGGRRTRTGGGSLSRQGGLNS